MAQRYDIDWSELVRRMIKAFDNSSRRVALALEVKGVETHESTIRAMKLRLRHGSQFSRAVALFDLAKEAGIEIPYQHEAKNEDEPRASGDASGSDS